MHTGAHHVVCVWCAILLLDFTSAPEFLFNILLCVYCLRYCSTVKGLQSPAALAVSTVGVGEVAVTSISEDDGCLAFPELCVDVAYDPVRHYCSSAALVAIYGRVITRNNNVTEFI